MARYTGPSCKQCRRERTKLNLKGSSCNTDKCIFSGQNNPEDNGKGSKDEGNGQVGK